MFTIMNNAIDTIYNITDHNSNGGEIIDANTMDFTNENDWLLFSRGLTNSLSDPFIIESNNDEIAFNFRNYDFKITHQGNAIHINASVSNRSN